MKQIKLSIAILTLALFSTSTNARDLGLDEVLKLHESGSIQSFEKLNQIVLAQHSGGLIRDTELEHEWGRYVYQMELVDAQGVEWDIELDATTGEILKNHQDD